MKKGFDVEIFRDGKYITVEVEFKLIFIMKHYHQKNVRCLTYSIILIDLIYESNKSYYPQQFLEECKFAVKDEIIKS